ncbi:Transmembrane protein 92, partial [Cricetulus griseus]
CPKGFRCCESGCCLPKETIWDYSKDDLRILALIVFLALLPLLCICGLMKRFCPKWRQPEQNLRSNHQIPPEAPTTASLEIWIPSLDPPPPYDQVLMKPVEPPPPYSLRPEDPGGPMRDTDNTAV